MACFVPKHPGIRKTLRPFAGDHDLVLMDGQMWETWRTLNPDFRAAHMMTLVPSIVDSLFKEYAISHLKILIFAGHDTAATILQVIPSTFTPLCCI